MTTRTPLVVVNGQTQQMPVGDTVPLTHGGTGATTAGDALTALGAVPSTRTLTMTAPLTGGGDLSENLTLGLSYDTTLQVVGGALGVSSLVALASHTHSQYVTSAGSVAYATSAGNSATTSQTTFGSLNVGSATGAAAGELRYRGNGTTASNKAITLAFASGDTETAINVPSCGCFYIFFYHMGVHAAMVFIGTTSLQIIAQTSGIYSLTDTDGYVCLLFGAGYTLTVRNRTGLSMYPNLFITNMEV